MAAATGALAGIRILDLTSGIAGPVGVLLLAEQGADVIKVEPPGGDPGRSQPGAPVWHRSRRSIALDLSLESDRTLFERFVGATDVVVHSPGAYDATELEAFGLGADALCELNPRLVHCSIPAYPPGHRAEGRAGDDALVQARAGIQWEQPGWRSGPIHLPFPAPSMAAAFLTASAVLAALIARERTGRGQAVTTSLYQGALAFTTQIWQEHERADPSVRAIMAKTYPPGIHQSTIHECAGGEWIHAATMNGGTPTSTLEEILGLDPVDQMALYTDPEAAAAHRAKLQAAFRERDRDELVAAMHAAGLGAEAIVPTEESFAHPQLIANDMVAEVVDPDLGPTTQVGVPVHLSATPGNIAGPQPRVDQDRAELIAELDAIEPLAEPLVPVAAAVTDGGGPLAGLRVLDLGQYLAGPFGPMILADLGADVVKVEPVRGDSMRMVVMPFTGCQRGKRGLAVDVKAPEGRDIVERLAATADVVHHNMTKGTAARLGVDGPALRRSNPDLVYCNTYAYGPEGPMSAFGGLDPLYQASAGLEHAAGPVGEGNAPLYIRLGMADTANALASVVGVLAAVLHRARTGETQDVWTSLLDAAAVLTSDVYLCEGEAARRPGLDAALTGPSPGLRLYETQSGWLQVAATTDEQWTSLCRTVGREDLATDARATTAADRVRHRDELGDELAEAFLRRTAPNWIYLLDAAGVPAEVSVDTYDGQLALHDGDNERLGLVTASSHPVLGTIRQFGALFSFSDTPVAPGGPPPIVGEHTREVLAEAGFETAEIDGHMAAGVIYEPDGDYRWSV